MVWRTMGGKITMSTTPFSTPRCSVTKGTKFHPYLEASKNLLSASSKLITFQIALRYCRNEKKVNMLAVGHVVRTKLCEPEQRVYVSFVYNKGGGSGRERRGKMRHGDGRSSKTITRQQTRKKQEENTYIRFNIMVL